MDRGLFNDATTSDENPTPGYMLSEIARATVANYQANTQLQDLIVSRLQNTNHNVKYKCLVITKYVCRSGRAEFKREMVKKTDLIKECLHYKGVPDPIRGDELNRRVREAAQEALDAIFDSQASVTTSAVMTANRIQGMGSSYVPESKPSSGGGILSSLVSNISSAVRGGDDSGSATYMGNHGATGSFNNNRNSSNMGNNMGSYNGPSGGGGSTGNIGGYSSSGGGSGGMSGVGNPNFHDPRLEKSLAERMTESVAGGILAVAGTMGSNNNSNLSSNAALPFQRNGTNEYNYASNRGPGAFNNASAAYVPEYVNNNNAGLSNLTRAGAAASDGSYERSMIEGLTEPGGLKVIPPEHKLTEFLNIAPTLPVDTIGTCIIEALNSDQWQTRVKALLTISSLVRARDCIAHAEYWVNNSEVIRTLTSDPKANVRTQASKTYKLVIGDGAEDTGSVHSAGPYAAKSQPQYQQSAQQSQVAAYTTSLLDGLDDAPPAAMLVPPPPAAVVAVNTDVNVNSSSALFEGMNLGGTSTNQYNGNGNGTTAMSSMTVTPMLTPTVTGSNKHQPQSALPFIQQLPQQQQQQSPGAPAANVALAFDFLDGMDNNNNNNAPAFSPPQQQQAPALAPAPAPMSIFDSMDLMASSAPLAPTITAAAAPAGQYGASSNIGAAGPSAGGFSFMSSGPARSSNPSSTISSAFNEPSAAQAANRPDAFAQLNASFGLGNSSPAAAPPVRPVGMSINGANGVPMAPSSYGVAPPQAGFSFVQQQPQQQGLGGLMMMSPGPEGQSQMSSAIAPSMLSATAPRKAIPSADAAGGGNSGFSFMGGAPAPNGSSAKNNNNDSFDFVTQAMRANTGSSK